MAVDSRSGLRWDHLNQTMRSNFSHAIRPIPSANEDVEYFVNLVALASDALINHGVKVLLSGSLADGSVVNPVLRSNTLDIDLMCIPKSLRISENDQRKMFRDVPSAPGFIWLRVPEPARVKDLVGKGKRSKHSKIKLASLKKVRGPHGGVEHYLVGECLEFPSNSGPEVGINLFDEFIRNASCGDLFPSIFGPYGFFYKSTGKEKGSAAFTSEASARLPHTEGQLKRFVFNAMFKLFEGIIEIQRGDSDSDLSSEEEEEEIEDIVMAPSTDYWRDELPGPLAICGSCEDSVSSQHATNREDGGAIQEEGKAGVYVSIGGSIDLVPAIECEGWPLKARGFISRQRQWPSSGIIREITQGGFHLVSKGSPEGNKEMEWRISFSVAEKTLFEHLSDFQRKCYQVFKSIYYGELTEPKVLSSYHMKTIFLWACERLPEEYWDEEKLAQIVLGLLDDLLHCLVTRSCPQYFIPGQNQFAHVPEELLLQHARKVCKIRSRPARYPSKAVQRRLSRGLVPDEDFDDTDSDSSEGEQASDHYQEEIPLD